MFLTIVTFLHCLTLVKSRYQDYKERWRNQYHYSPLEGFMNDPNGLVYYKGEKFMYYQFHPNYYRSKTGSKTPAHWGVAKGDDLVHWKEMGIALYNETKGQIFSGSAVVDASGITAIYTLDARDLETQNIAFSSDGLRYQKYSGNPVVERPGKHDFRDPKVIRYNDEYWVMTVSLCGEHKVAFYKSNDLKEWELLSEWGGFGILDCWECPNMVDFGNGIWILYNSVQFKVQYFLGTFDGTIFKPLSTELRLLDYGPDCYATQNFFTDEKDDRLIQLTWMSRWSYASSIPTDGWKGSMTIPRELVLKNTLNGEPVLHQVPISELQDIRKESIELKAVNIREKRTFIVEFAKTCEIEMNGIHSEKFELYVHMSENKQRTIIGFDGSKLYMNRSRSGVVDFDADFKNVVYYSPPLDSLDNLRIFLDWSSVEVFINDGMYTMTMIVFPEEYSDEIILENLGTDDMNVDEVVFHSLESIW